MTGTLNRKTIFDTVRTILGRGFRQAEVAALDAAIDWSASEHNDPVQDRVPCVPSCMVSPVGIQLIKLFEGLALLRDDGLIEAYPDPGTGGDPWTIGWGATGADDFNGGRIGPGTVWTREQADSRLEQDLERYAAEVARALGDAPTSQEQFDALVSFHYNTGAIDRATLTRLHKAGEYDAAADEFQRWVFAGGRQLRGLKRRRDAEANLYRA